MSNKKQAALVVENPKTGERYYLDDNTCVTCSKVMTETVLPEEYVRYFNAGFCSLPCWEEYLKIK